MMGKVDAAYPKSNMAGKVEKSYPKTYIVGRVDTAYIKHQLGMAGVVDTAFTTNRPNEIHSQKPPNFIIKLLHALGMGKKA